MHCPACYHSGHAEESCRTYVAGQGWCKCDGAMPGSIPHGVTTIVPGNALKRMHYTETKAFVEKALKGAGKPPERVRRAMQNVGN